jgi:hypothetical protein
LACGAQERFGACSIPKTGGLAVGALWSWGRGALARLALCRAYDPATLFTNEFLDPAVRMSGN